MCCAIGVYGESGNATFGSSAVLVFPTAQHRRMRSVDLDARHDRARRIRDTRDLEATWRIARSHLESGLQMIASPAIDVVEVRRELGTIGVRHDFIALPPYGTPNVVQSERVTRRLRAGSANGERGTSNGGRNASTSDHPVSIARVAQKGEPVTTTH